MSHPHNLILGFGTRLGLAGIRIHDLAPATIEAPVWDLHAEDVAALGGRATHSSPVRAVRRSDSGIELIFSGGDSRRFDRVVATSG